MHNMLFPRLVSVTFPSENSPGLIQIKLIVVGYLEIKHGFVQFSTVTKV